MAQKCEVAVKTFSNSTPNKYSTVFYRSTIMENLILIDMIGKINN